MDNQLMLDESPTESKSHLLLFAPAICAIISIFLLLIQKYLSGFNFRGTSLNRSVQNATAHPPPPRLYSSGFPVHADRRSRVDPESQANFWKIIRLVVCIVLVVLCIVATVFAEPCAKAEPGESGTLDEPDFISVMKYGYGHGRKHRKRHPVELCLSREQSEQLFLAAFYTYASLLALLAVALRSNFRAICNSHVATLLISALAIDIWVVLIPFTPISRFPSSNTPLDWLSRARVAILAFAAILVPFYIQRAYHLREKALKKVPARGSTAGRLVVERLTARYSPSGPAVLHNLSFTIDAGERVGVVGKAPGDKKTLVLALLRLIHTEGTVHLDGIPTHTMATDALRSHIALISEHPDITYGTVKQTLSPRGQHADAVLNSALHSTGVDVSNVELDDLVDELSGGQRMGVAFARAIVGRSKVMILDEGKNTANENATIRSKLRTELPNSTLIIIARRLEAVRDVDKVLVIDGGKVIEFGSPSILLGKRSGVFKTIVEETEDRDELCAMFRK